MGVEVCGWGMVKSGEGCKRGRVGESGCVVWGKIFCFDPIFQSDF